MKHPHGNEKGQALILIALAAVGLFAFAALAIDGSMAFSNKRQAQNAADSSALAAALAYSRGTDPSTAASTRATTNGFDGGAQNDVTVTITDAPAGVCPANTDGKDITVDIVSQVNTSITRVIGRSTITNAVTATARSCASFFGPPFGGNAIVSLSKSGKGYDGTGTPDWTITGGGIFSNSSSSDAAYCNGDADISAPSMTVVGGTQLLCNGATIPTTVENAPAYSNDMIASFFPRIPACNGTATLSGGQWQPQANTDGSKVAWNSDADFAPGLYCITNSPGPFHSAITGSEVTFFMMSANFSMSLNGGGSITASAPTSGEYEGILMYLIPQVDANGNLVQTQEIDLQGNGSGDIQGTIWAPSANVTMFGNSGSEFNSQIIGYSVDSGGTSNITINYLPDDNDIVELPIVISLLK